MSVGSPGASRIIRIARVRGLCVHGDLQSGPEAGPQMGQQTWLLSWTTQKRAACCWLLGGNQVAAQNADPGRFDGDPGEAQ